jgi:signal transduction histidine kinase
MTGPRLRINLALFATLLLLVGVFYTVGSQPYLGFKLITNSTTGQVQVSDVEPWVAEAGLKPGDRPVLMTASDGFSLDTHPRHFPSSTLERRKYYKNKSERFAEQAILYRLFSQDTLMLTLFDGRQVSLSLDHYRPLSSVELESWLRLFFGLFSWVVGLLVWVWNTGKRDSIYLMLCGLGLFVTTIPSSVYALDMYILHPVLVWGLSYTTALGTFYFLVFGTCVLLYFPQPVKNVSHWNKMILSASVLYLLVVVINTWDWALTWGEQTLYISDVELYTFICACYPIMVVLCIQQWLNSKHNPVARARANWIALSWLAGPSIFMLFYLLPMSLGETPLLNRTWAWGAIMSVFWMTLLGVGRFRLFSIEHHINTAWHWFLVTLFFFSLDVLLVSAINLSAQSSIIVILMLVLWVYLPIRQWLYQRFSRDHIHNYNAIFNDAVNELLRSSLSSHQEAREAWKNTLNRSFAPISITTTDINTAGDIDTGILKHRGQAMIVAANRFSPALYIDYAKKGGRLFTQKDIELTHTLRLLFERLYDFRGAFLAGQTQERDRIRRDLHDQIGHKLLSLIYAAKDDKARQLAQDTMEQLRELIRALRHEPVALDNMIAESRQVAEDICQHAQKTLHWRDHTGDTQNELHSHHYLNILNIIRELLNNAIRHANAKSITVTLSKQDNRLTIELADDGIGFDPENVTLGNGLNNIKSRTQELGATINWHKDRGTNAILVIPGVF